MQIFSKTLRLPVSTSEAFAWHKRMGAFSRLVPAWDDIDILQYPDQMIEGSLAEIYLKVFGPFGFRWLLQHCDYIPGGQFSDLQLSGPFKYYKHKHLFREPGSICQLEDRIEYELPLEFFTKSIAVPLINRRLERTFRYRHRLTFQDLQFHSKYSSEARLKFLISGATGMIGQALCSFLTCAGHSVSRILRAHPQAQVKKGDILISDRSEIQIDKKRQFDCIINLAGAPLAEKRWTALRKKKLLESRVDFTRKLVAALKVLEKPPSTFISASGIGFYGDNADYPNESTSKGEGFLAELADKWEKAASHVSEFDCRLVSLRLAPVLSGHGGILQKLLPPFSFGLGARLGNGKQRFAWVSIDDVLRAILFSSYNNQLEGAINLSAPSQISNSEFTSALARSLNRPAFFAIPDKVLHVLFGEVAAEMMLASSSAHPKKLLDAGFDFLFENPESAIKASLGLC